MYRNHYNEKTNIKKLTVNRIGTLITFKHDHLDVAVKKKSKP
jgi:hypothetical protein